MSFIKKLLEKRKDMKYGPGHKLSDGKADQQQQHGNMAGSRDQYQIACSSNNEAALKAAEAAMQRFNVRNPPPKSAIQRQLSREAAQSRLENEEMQKALKLKEHYFGQPKLVKNEPSLTKNRIFYKSDLFPGEKYLKNEIEDKIEQTLLDRMNEDPILVAATLLFTANHKQTEKLVKCKETLTRIVDNILNNPREEKFRKIRIENKMFNENVYSCKYSQMLMANAGFKTKPFPKDDGSGGTDDCFIFEMDEDLSKLENLKSSLAMVEPVLPELDRDIKIFKLSHDDASFRNYKLSDEYNMDDFYNLKVDELIREQALRNEALEKQGMLRTKAMRERDEQLELRRYNFCLIRVKFPDDYILEGLFRTNETLGEVYELVSENLVNDGIPFELAGPSLRKSSSSSTNTLAEAGLAPAALLYFKVSDLIGQNQLAELLQNSKTFLKIQ